MSLRGVDVVSKKLILKCAMLRQVLSVCAVGFVLVAGTAVAKNNDFVTAQKLMAAINSRNIDRILELLNLVKGMKYQGDILPVIVDFWRGNREKYPNLEGEYVNKDIVRVSLANILLQAERNERIRIKDKLGMFEFVEDLIDSDDVDVAAEAIFTLSLFDNEKAVDIIFAIASQGDRRTFRIAVVSLVWMCTPAAHVALDRLYAEVKTSGNREFIAENREKARRHQEKTGGCH